MENSHFIRNWLATIEGKDVQSQQNHSARIISLLAARMETEVVLRH
jgi:hypothetical protein